MQQWFSQLSTRDQRVLLLGGGLAMGLLFFWLVWLPLQREKEMLQNTVLNQREALAWMQRAQGEIGQLRAVSAGGERAVGAESLMSVIDQSMRQNGLEKANKRIEPKGESEVRVSFEQVNFNALIQWLGDLAGRQIGVDNVTVERLAEGNQVKVRLVLIQL